MATFILLLSEQLHQTCLGLIAELHREAVPWQVLSIFNDILIRTRSGCGFFGEQDTNEEENDQTE